MTIEELNKLLDKLAVREQETEAQRVTWADWFKNATALEERLKIHDNLKGLNDIILGVQEERQTLLNAMKIQLERGCLVFCSYSFSSKFCLPKRSFRFTEQEAATESSSANQWIQMDVRDPESISNQYQEDLLAGRLPLPASSSVVW